MRALIRRMSIENPLWGAPRIHGELLKLGLAVAQSSVAKYMVKGRGPPSQGWCTFLHNHAPDIAAMDSYILHGWRLLKRARKNFTSSAISASDNCAPKAGMDRPSAPTGGVMPFRIACTTLSGTGA